MSATAGVVVVGWGTLLIVAFLFFRGDDVGLLPTLLASLKESITSRPIFGIAGFINSVLGALIASLIFLSWFGLGDLIMRLLTKIGGASNEFGEVPSRALEWARTCSYGAGAWSLLWFALGLAGLFRKQVAIVALLIGLGLCLLAIARRSKSAHNRKPLTPVARTVLVLVLMLQVLMLISALAPPTAKDTLLYHLALPKAFISSGSLQEVPYNIAGYLPLGAEMHSLWAMLLGNPGNPRIGEAASGAILFSFFPLLLTVVYGWAQEQGLDRGWALCSVLIVASIPTAFHVAASGYIDLALTLYLTLALQAIGKWWTTLDSDWLIHLALSLACALCIKLTAIYIILPLALIVLLKARQALRNSTEDKRGMSPPANRIALTGLAALAAACILASPWYIKTWTQTGSPVFPFYMNIWKGNAPGWDTERSLLFQELNSRYGGYPKSVLDYLTTPARLSLLAQPEQSRYFDGVLGVTFLFGLPLLIWSLWWRLLNIELRIAAAVSGVLFVFWLFSSQQLRYLLPALPGLAVAMTAAGAIIADGIGKNGVRLIQGTLLGTALAAVLVTLAWFIKQNPLPVFLGGESREHYLERQLDYYQYYEIVNSQLPATARVWLINMRRDTYYIDRPYFSDYIFEDYTLRKYVDGSDNVGDLRKRVREAGITHLLVRHDVLLDYNKSPIVDDRRTQQQNDSKMKLLKSFLMEGTRIIRQDGRFMLIELPME